MTCRFAYLAAVISSVFARNVPAQTTSSDPIGTWRGTSLCQVRPSACNDESVVFRITRTPTSDSLALDGRKIIDAVEVEMGVLGCRLDAPAARLTCPTANAVWVFTIRGDSLVGELRLLDGTRVREVRTRRSGQARGNAAPVTRAGHDPVTMDPPVRDSVHPPRLAELAFESAGARLNGIFYLPAGPGPHPVVMLLHGNPGNERNLDVAQALRRAGYATLYFNYRGSWGSGGTFSRTHAIEDVQAALRFVRSPLAADRYRVDSARVALVGHSMGGWLALLTAARDPGVRCVGALDFVNTGARGRRLLNDRAADSARTVEDSWLTAPGGPYRAAGGGVALVAEVKANAEQWDVLASAAALRERRVLLVGSANRTEHDSLVAALGGPFAPRLTAHWWPTDHSFSDRRIALAHAILDWLRGPCGL